MTPSFPARVDVVIIGGGIVGCSVAYHLTRLGITDVLLLERRQLTCGTTWHAAGLIGQLRATRRMTELAKYTSELLHALEAETGQATGFKQNGSISLALNAERFEELKRGASMAKNFGLAVEVIGPAEIKARYPLLEVGDAVGGVFLPKDGQANPIDTTQAFAKGARQRGARIVEGVKVERILVEQGRAVGVMTDQGPVAASTVVLAAGMWSRELASAVGVSVPLHAAEHFYIVTEPLAEVPRDLPVLRVTDECTYYKEDAGKLLVGAFEPVAKPWGMNGIPEAFCFDSLPEDMDHFEPILDSATRRLPILATAGIQTFFNGPESFTPDDRYLLGETAELRDLFVATGFNSIGIQSSGGAGKVLAEWIRDRRMPVDLTDVDVRRLHPFQSNRTYLRDRTTETLGLLYAMHWPYRQYATARGVRRSPFHDRLVAAGAVMGETAGWERPNWYAPPGISTRVPLLLGPAELVRAHGRRMPGGARRRGPVRPVELRQVPGRGQRTPAPCSTGSPWPRWMCPPAGSSTPSGATSWAASRPTSPSPAWPRPATSSSPAPPSRPATSPGSGSTSPPTHAAASSTSLPGLPMLGLMGPRSRDLLQKLSGEDLSNAAFPFATSRELEIGYARVRASRITYVGELGWELYVPAEFATHVFDRIVEAGREFGLTHRRLPRHERLPHGEGLPPLGPRHRPRGRPARRRPGLLRRLGQAGRLPRSRRAAPRPRGRHARPAAWSSSACWTTRSCSTMRSRSGRAAGSWARSPRGCTGIASARPSAWATCTTRTA